tara:strand:- start:606 stop:890 length:285 start_codon:yes stop_codon:yes gene_type:complete
MPEREMVMGIERLWKARFELDENECILTKNDGYVIQVLGKVMEVSNLQVECDIWAKDRTTAMRIAIKGSKGTKGLVQVSIGKTHSNSRATKTKR